jgi:glyoxylase-like metal-dependent hydrolase (beta-lactamase superfamily II)
MHSFATTDEITVLHDSVEVPGLGHLPVNAFLLRAAQPVLVDAGLPTSKEQFLHELWSLVDPTDLRWVWLTHPDRDHTGALYEVLEAAPQARLVTPFLGLGILSIERPVPTDRVFLLNPGQSLDVGDRELVAFRPPVYDSPATTGFYDRSTGVCFSSDCFGAPMADAALAGAQDLRAVQPEALVPAQRLWATVDSPWVTGVDRTRFAEALQPLRQLDPPVVLSTHLPPATGRAQELLDVLATAPDADPFIGPDQAALEQMLTGLEPMPA